ncbi:MAG TPA: 50S ribosomal protein L25 [Candidatus Binataceae bacterium]|jgi:large subunit ribosomal protein L25|nr:50S ribosomal protein L25 [Candidatus Binataceae bacterium]
METIDLACEKRPTSPKGVVNRLRRQGRVPGIIYGNHREAIPVAVAALDLRKRVDSAAHQRLIRISSEAPELAGKHVIVKELQRTPVDGDILHIDFYEVDLAKPLRVSVQLRFVGRAAGIVDGGILQPLEREIEVECLPLEIPEAIEVDVTPLNVHDVMHVSALKFAGNIKPIFDTDFPVVTVLPPTVAEAPAAAAPAEGAEAPAAEGAGAEKAAGEAAKEAPAKS